MLAHYHAMFQDFTLETSAETITLTSRLKTVRVSWERIISAGPLVLADKFPMQLPAAAPSGTPRIVAEFENFVRDFEQIWISYTDDRGRQQLTNVPVPLGGVGDQFISELRSHIGDRWTTDPAQMPRRQPSHHFWLRKLWIIPVLLFLMLLALVALLVFASGVAVLQVLVAKYWYLAIFAFGFYYGIQKIRGKV